jgi:hypothetical protein
VLGLGVAQWVYVEPAQPSRPEKSGASL